MNNRLDELYQHSEKLRAMAVDTLRQKHRRLFLQGRETLKAHDLVTAAAQQYDLSPEEYCDAMEKDCVWGGGPEIVALSNTICRPIHVYELTVDDTGSAFVLRRMACFGSPRFDRRQPLHILSADSRFPDVQPGQQLAAGNHFLAVFPQKRKRGKRLRGGAGLAKSSARGKHDDDQEEEYDGDDEELALSRLVRWWQNLVQRLCD
jgi:hypothetical protein